MAVSYNDFLIELYQEYLEEASFLYEQRLALFDDPEISWRDIDDFETRFEPHIDGLVVGGDLALKVCTEQVETGDFGELHTAVRVFCRQHRQDLVETVLETLDFSDDDRVQAVIDALKHNLPDEWSTEFIAKLAKASDNHLRIAATVIGYRRIPAGNTLMDALDKHTIQPLPDVIWAIGRIRDKRAGALLLQHLTRGDDPIKSAVALALLRIGDPQTAQTCALNLASADWPILALGLAGAPSIVQRLLGLASRRSSPEILVSLGMLGDMVVVDTLLANLREDALDAYATMGLNLITGADLYEDIFVPDPIDEDELFEEELEKLKVGKPLYPEGEQPGTTLVQLTRDSQKWHAWWRQNQSLFKPGIRYRNGRPYDPLCLLENLLAEKNPALIRKIAYEELVVRYDIDVPFETDMTVRDQLHAISRIKKAIKSENQRFKAGRWYFAGRQIQ